MGGGEESVDGFVAATVGTVLDYDRRRGTALAQTLEAYFGAGGSPARAAELLHVHVNTVSQRLERLATLLGEDWQRPERALEIQLALRLHRLRRRIARPHRRAGKCGRPAHVGRERCLIASPESAGPREHLSMTWPAPTYIPRRRSTWVFRG